VNASWLGLILCFSAASAGAATELEAPDARSYAEATPEMLARRAQTCRADLQDYQKQATVELMDRLIVCLEHPDAGLRAEVLDLLPDRRLWDLPDYETRVRPALQEVEQRFQHDPDRKVQLHLIQLSSWLFNGEHWLKWDSPAAQARRAAEERRPRRHPRVDGESLKLGGYVFVATVIAVLLIGLFGWLFKVD
jgi:hypothetical protein